MEEYALLDVVVIPLRNLNDLGARLFDDGVATEATVELDVGGGLHAIKFEVFRLTDPGRTFSYPEMACGAGADATTSVVKEDAVVLGDIREAHWQAVSLVGKRVEGKLNGLAFGQEGDANHALGCRFGEIYWVDRFGAV